MKRIIKSNSKKGFTLLEVMLAVAILTITSAMIMNGFLATMKYSTNTSIYSRCGSYDYATTIAKLSTFSSKTNAERYQNGAIAASGSSGHVEQVTLEGIAAPLPNSVYRSNGMYVVHWEEEEGGAVDERDMFAVSESSEQNGSVDDRHSFFYMPTSSTTHNRYICPNGHIGYIQPCVYLDGPSNPHFVCLYEDETGHCWAICDEVTNP